MDKKQNLMTTPCEIDIVVAHNEALPPALRPMVSGFALDSVAARRKMQKQISRALANFLLAQLFQRHQLDSVYLSQIQRQKNGRPYIPQLDVDFNISHSGDWVAIIFSVPKSVVGIDIEHPQKIRDYAALLKYYASPQEYEILMHNTDVLNQIPDLTSRFYLSWCLREAVLKTQGVGIIKLAEVAHYPELNKIETAHCPKGELHFYYQLPFYLSYFFEQRNVLSSVRLFEWKNHQLQHIDDIQPIIYHVN